MKKNKAFTLIELIGVLVIMAILALIVIPFVLSIIRSAKISARKRSVDAYGRSVELAIAGYLLDTGTFPTDLHNLTVEYSGNIVECNVMAMKENGGLYMSKCKVNDKDVKDSATEDGWYHYGVRDLTNEEYVDMYGKAIEAALKKYYNEHNNYPSDISKLTIDYSGELVEASIMINKDGTVYLTDCRVSGIAVDTVYGKDKRSSAEKLVANSNSLDTLSYSEGNIHQMYTFSHPATEQTPALTDYRYIGNDSYNYVKFNGNEMWRIIGVFDVDDGTGNLEQRIKIVKNTKLESNKTWETGDCNWVNASLKNFLNGDFYNSLNGNDLEMIVSSNYYLGTGNLDSTHHFGTAEEMYVWERGTNSNGFSNLWNGKIALLYPSDYAYTYALEVDNACYNDPFTCNNSYGKINSWIYNINGSSSQWLLSTSSYNKRSVFYMKDNGIISYTGGHGFIGVLPTLYLSSQVKITSGDGTIDNPYQLSM